MVGYYGPAMILTYLNIVSSLVGMHLVLTGNLTGAVIMLMLSGFFDMFDGAVARMKQRSDRERNYGIQVDSLADIVSFGMFPVIIGYTIGLKERAYIPVLICYVLAGVIRLSYFNATELENQQKQVKRTHYMGLPITSVTIILPIVIFFANRSVFFPDIYAITLLVLSVLFVLRVKVPKPQVSEVIVKRLLLIRSQIRRR